jgi:predicted dehydrogenase/nucleoside-diphosphate-sugar epimerase
LPLVRIVAVADPLANREELSGLLSDDARLFEDAATMLADARPDVVHIVTPPASHASLALMALRAGCHVYIEKPFAQTRTEAEEILSLAAQRGLQVCAGHQCQMDDAAMLAMAALPEIGRLVHAESVLSFRMVRRGITPAEQTKDILPHAVYPLVEQMRAATGSSKPLEVRAVEARGTGDVYALLSLDGCTGVLTVSLSGRPVEQYQHLIGTNGSLRADYVIDGVVKLLGPGAGVGVLFTPFRRGLQTLKRATAGVYKLLTGRGGSYRGLGILIERFYSSIRTGQAAPIPSRSIIDTVSICERIGRALDEADAEVERGAHARLLDAESTLPALRTDRGFALVTGGTGFLGRAVAETLRNAGLGVRVLARRMPGVRERVPGVEYVRGDLAQAIDPATLSDVTVVVHCAAETAGGRADHERNSVAATRRIIEAAASSGVRRIIHVSSLAVLKSTGRVLDEQSPIDAGNLARGPYVWGKAQSEELARALAAEQKLALKILRPGPLVDFEAFQAPGRLGRELGPWFVAVGSRRAPLSVCDVHMMARVIRSYVEDFDAAPPLVNLVNAPASTRGELADRVRQGRPDLRFFWVPSIFLRLMNGPAKLVQRVVFGAKKPIDVYAAFASERYDTRLAAAVISRASERQLSTNES